jgi:hypothetical protein
MKKNNLFNSILNNNYKSIPFKTKTSDVGEIKYLPPVSKEWKNTVYSYNNNNSIKNFPINNLNANKVIQNYFKLYFKDSRFIDSRHLGIKKKRNNLRRIYTSKIETKHTNSKIIATLYTFNPDNRPQKIYGDEYLKINKNILRFWKQKLKKRINLTIKNNDNILFLSDIPEKNLFIFKYKLLNESLKWYNLYIKLYLTTVIKYLYNNKLRTLRKFQFNYYLDKFKFEKEMFLSKLGNFLQKIYNNKIEFNIVNLSTFTYSTDMITEYLTFKLKKRNVGVSKEINKLLNTVKLVKVNRIKEKSEILKERNPYLLENKYKNLSLLSVLNSDNTLNKLLKEITNYNSKSLLDKNSKEKLNEDYTSISNIIFNSIKYKNMGGIRIQVGGRLTKRYRADRSINVFKWKGGLKNIDSSYKKLSTVVYKGYNKPNVIYSLSKSKRRVGSFAVKGWISGK